MPEKPISPNFKLTPREVEVLTLCSEGYRRADVAVRLGVHLNTVKNITAMICAKLEADNITHAVAVAVRKNLIP